MLNEAAIADQIYHTFLYYTEITKTNYHHFLT